MHGPPVSPKKSPGPSEAMITSPSLANGLEDEVELRAVELPEGGVFTRPEPIFGKGGVFTASREPEAAASCSSRGMVLKVTAVALKVTQR